MSQQVNEEPRPTSEPPTNPGGLRIGILTAAVTFACFCAYAFLSPATYRATATVVIESSSDSTAFGPLEAARRLHEAVLDRDLLARFSTEQAPAASPEARIQIARAIQAAFQIDSVDGHVFTVSFSDSDPARVERRCNELAVRAVERGPRLLAPERDERQRALDEERRRRVNDLVAFLAAHPELSGATESKQAAREGTDAELLAEKARIEARIAEREARGSSDNPYTDTPNGDAEAAQLVRRLADINAALGARQTTSGPKSARPKPSPEIMAEWQRLLAEVGKARVAAEAAKSAPVTFKARLVSRAVAPTSPVEPNRPLWLLVGAAASLAAFALSALAGKALGQRGAARGLGSYPPAGFGSSFPPASSANPPASELSSAPPLPLPEIGSESYQSSSAPPALAAAPASSLPSPFPPATDLRSSTPAPLPMPDASQTSVSLPPARVIAITNDSQSASAPPRVLPSVEPRRPGGDGAAIGARSERALRAAVEVNADVPAAHPARHANSSNPPLPRVAPTSARTTQVLGSPIQPILAPGSRRTSSAGASPSPSRTTPTPATGYSYVSTPPPFEANSAPSSGPASPRPTTISTRPAPPGWRADLSLLPESRRALCNEIYPQAVDRCLVIAVLGGSGSAEGKSRLAAELALALAESGHPRVLVLEGNLQRPAVRRFLRVDMPSGLGMSQQLRSRIEVRARRPWTVVECTPTLHVLAEGSQGTPELMLSRPFEDCVTELRSFYDFIIVDGPMLDDPASCRAVEDVIDGAVLLSSSRDDADLQRARSLFPGKRISTVNAAR
jgi:Mrp family chromosome partitioning ATPase